MTYYIIRFIGDNPIIDDIVNYSFKDAVIEKDGNFFVMDSYTDMDYGTQKVKARVYPTKQEAWKVVLKDLDDHISHMQKVRDDAFHKALDDGAFVKTPEEFNKWMDGIKGEPSNNLFESRNKVK